MKHSQKKKLIVFTGAGISAESGLSTFRGQNGLWDKYRIEDVATYEAWKRNPALVLEFYNMRRKQLLEASPNAAHYAIAGWENHFDLEIITQNIDDLHERAGSSKVLHLHGELRKAQSTVDPSLIYPIKSWQLNLGDTCEKGSQLRPYVVWFGEPVPKFYDAIEKVRQCDFFVVIGTSLVVYPAAQLLEYVPDQADIYLIDPEKVSYPLLRPHIHIAKKATEGVKELEEKYLKKYFK
ncbi:MAG: NAD-dependent protein deacylase [Vicingaceae bacterium]|nr:MAG: NAD-dependent protein deacylase [Vicingaceae bacterium]